MMMMYLGAAARVVAPVDKGTKGIGGRDASVHANATDMTVRIDVSAHVTAMIVMLDKGTKGIGVPNEVPKGEDQAIEIGARSVAVIPITREVKEMTLRNDRDVGPTKGSPTYAHTSVEIVAGAAASTITQINY